VEGGKWTVADAAILILFKEGKRVRYQTTTHKGKKGVQDMGSSIPKEKKKGEGGECNSLQKRREGQLVRTEGILIQ